MTLSKLNNIIFLNFNWSCPIKTLNIDKKHTLAPYTTFKIGGEAEFFCTPANGDELIEALKFASEQGLPYYILGGGANTLFADTMIKGLVISTLKMDSIEIDEEIVHACAGVDIGDLNEMLTGASLSGMEFAGGLPGTLGGAVYMNARCYGGEMSMIVESVGIVDGSFEKRRLSLAELDYSYKNSIFMHKKDYIITDVTLKLQRGSREKIIEDYKSNLEDRKGKGQFSYPSAGCIFKNDYDTGIPTGKLIDSLGLKGKAIGGAEIYERHCNFIINKEQARAEDVLKLIEFVEEEVFRQKGIKLEREVRVIG